MSGTWKQDGDTWEYHDGEIVIWCKDAPQGIVRHAWLRDGQMAVPLPKDGVIFSAALGMLKDAVLNDYYWCNKCNATITRETEGGTHFAGHYCKECYKKYQAENARKCRICGRPLWDCYC